MDKFNPAMRLALLVTLDLVDKFNPAMPIAFLVTLDLVDDVNLDMCLALFREYLNMVLVVVQVLDQDLMDVELKLLDLRPLASNSNKPDELCTTTASG